MTTDRVCWLLPDFVGQVDWFFNEEESLGISILLVLSKSKGFLVVASGVLNVVYLYSVWCCTVVYSAVLYCVVSCV